MLDKSTDVWSLERESVPLHGVGNINLLSLPLTAFFASRRCPGVAIRAGTEWALAIAKEKRPVVSGFHSPLEQSVLRLLLQARSPVIHVIARPVAEARLDKPSQIAVAEGNMAVVTAHVAKGRLTQALAVERNDLAALLASNIVIAHAEPEGQLSAAVIRWLADGLVVSNLYECP